MVIKTKQYPRNTIKILIIKDKEYRKKENSNKISMKYYSNATPFHLCSRPVRRRQ